MATKQAIDGRQSVRISAHGANPEVCYVRTFQGPRSVWATWAKGSDAYRTLDHDPDRTAYGQSAALLRRAIEARGIRWGSYGDPAALPLRILRRWSGIGRHTGYSHQWKRYPALRSLLMASVDSESEAREARRRGFRTFRVIQEGEPETLEDFPEVLCPASDEAGKRTDCQTCGLCNGAAGSTGPRPSNAPRADWNPARVSGIILYEGPSRIDGAPIVAIATGLDDPSSNEKTGPMIQTWIMRSDIPPHVAQSSGDDASVCADCKLRPLLQRIASGAQS